MPRNIRKRNISNSDEEEEHQESEQDIKEKIEELKFVQKQRERTHGVDVFSLAIGSASSDTTAINKFADNDPWKLSTGGLVDLKTLKEKRGHEIVQNMHSTFAKETNQRDEDAEMQKFIEEQLLKKKLADKEKEVNSQNDSLIKSDSNRVKIKRPEDALFDLPKYLIASSSKNKSEETLSEQMLSGIPEVDLGVEERIRTIEETEKAKQKLLTHKNANKASGESTYVPSVNFVQHKRFDDTLLNQESIIKAKMTKMMNQTAKVENQPVVGDVPKHELLQPKSNTKRKTDEPHQSKSSKKNSQPGEKATDEYCFERFKKNMRINRGSKIKIA